MTRIDSNQQLIALVRQQLNRVSRAKTERVAKAKSKKGDVQTRELSSAQQIAESGEFSEEEIQRAVIHGILVEEFGDGLINEAQFQQIVSRITNQLRYDAEAAELLRMTVKDLSSN